MLEKAIEDMFNETQRLKKELVNSNLEALKSLNISEIFDIINIESER